MTDPLENLYDSYMMFNNQQLEKHKPLEIAAILVTQGLSIYKSAMSPDEYEKMVDLISSKRDEVKTFNTTVVQ